MHTFTYFCSPFSSSSDMCLLITKFGLLVIIGSLIRIYYYYFIWSYFISLFPFLSSYAIFSSLILLFSLRPTRVSMHKSSSRDRDVDDEEVTVGCTASCRRDKKTCTSSLDITTTDCKYFSFSHLSSPILFVHRSGQPLSYTTENNSLGRLIVCPCRGKEWQRKQ